MRPARSIELTERALAVLAGNRERDVRPRAYTGPFPIPNHRSLAEVEAQQQGKP